MDNNEQLQLSLEYEDGEIYEHDDDDDNITVTVNNNNCEKFLSVKIPKTYDIQHHTVPCTIHQEIEKLIAKSIDIYKSKTVTLMVGDTYIVIDIEETISDMLTEFIWPSSCVNYDCTNNTIRFKNILDEKIRSFNKSGYCGFFFLCIQKS